jgi:hypothetical protein
LFTVRIFHCSRVTKLYNLLNFLFLTWHENSVMTYTEKNAKFLYPQKIMK